MDKRHVNALDRAGDIANALRAGALLTTWDGERVNTMVIGWGTVGTLWGRPIFVAYVRENRYTRSLLDARPEFTVSIPAGRLDRDVMAVCGSESGREMDKLAAVGLTTMPSEAVSVPALRGFPLTLECRVVYRDRPVDAGFPMKMDAHVCYYGEIVSAYEMED